MKKEESEYFLNSFRKYNFKIEFKDDIYEYTDKNANPIFETVLLNKHITIPILI